MPEGFFCFNREPKDEKMKRFKIPAAMVAGLLLLLTAAGTSAGAHEKPRPVKQGILLVAFGTSVPEARRAYANIERMMKAAFPDVPIRWAYTSSMIRSKLAKQGQSLDSMETALAKMRDEGFTHVGVQSLHMIAGWEFQELQQNAGAFGAMAGGFDRITVGGPLLASQEDFTKVTEALMKNLPPARKPAEAVVFMGHGTSHSSNAGYPALMYYLQRRDPLVFMGTVEESPTIEEIKQVLIARQVKTAYVMPFMAVAGDHAANDLAGEEDASWKSILTRAGIKCIPVLKGSAEFDDITVIWVDHLKAALSRWEAKP
jgi:sirohydrochlorin cobaltochelatase